MSVSTAYSCIRSAVRAWVYRQLSVPPCARASERGCCLGHLPSGHSWCGHIRCSILARKEPNVLKSLGSQVSEVTQRCACFHAALLIQEELGRPTSRAPPVWSRILLRPRHSRHRCHSPPRPRPSSL